MDYVPAKKCGVPGCFNPLKAKEPVCRRCVKLMPREMTEDLGWFARQVQTALSDIRWRNQLLTRPDLDEERIEQISAGLGAMQDRADEAIAAYQLTYTAALTRAAKILDLRRAERSRLIGPGASLALIREFSPGAPWGNLG